ncbi:protein phosphatase 2C domain-containing protein [Streptomyces synnematoformans]|uniref:PPM-type phosphatase domain-containing protein n=1 Tax=Streptomyces synnematoformans TaxID=415721 RepID=A0ABN1ZI98_9ACTN
MIIAGAAVQGTAHLAAAQGCQDAFKAVDLGGAAVLAVSDGAGSRDRSALGAHLAVDAACRLLARDVPDGAAAPERWTRWIAGRGRRVVGEYLRAVSGVLGAGSGPAEPGPGDPGAARAGPADPGALAATLTAAVVAPPWVAFVSLGDGFGTLLTRDDRSHLVLPPPAGPAAFLSSPAAGLRIRTFAVWEPELGGVAVVTDGLAALALDHPSGRGLPPAAGPLPAGRFFAGVAAALRASGGDAGPLRRLLSGPEAARTGDDLTLLCALVEGR